MNAPVFGAVKWMQTLDSESGEVVFRTINDWHHRKCFSSRNQQTPCNSPACRLRCRGSFPLTFSRGGCAMSIVRSDLNRRQLLGGILAAGSSPFISGFLPGTSRGEDDKAATAGRIKQ